jgi:hypothetical protein
MSIFFGDRAASSMAHDQDHLCPREFASEFHAAKDTGDIDITRHLTVEDVTDAEIQNRFG